MPQLEAADIIRKTIEDNVALMGDKIKEVQTSEGEERAKLVEQLDELKKQVDGLQSELDEANSRPNFSGIEVTQTGEKGKFSLGRMVKLLYGVARQDDPEYGYEMEVVKIGAELMNTQAVPDSMKASINASSDASGGFLIPTELISDLIPELDAQEVAIRAGATVINGLTGNVTWVVDNGGITAQYIDSEAEESISETASTFSNITMSPHVAAALVPFTWSMLNQPALALDIYAQDRIGTKLALLEDQSAFLGSGSNSAPTGLFNKAGISTVTLSATTGLNWGQGATTSSTSQPIVDEDFLALVESVASGNGLNPVGKLSFVTGQKVHANLGLAKDLDGKLLYRQPGEVMPASIGGYPIFSTTQLNGASSSAHQIAFGNFKDMLIGRWGAMSFAASDTAGNNFAKVRTSIRGVMAHDIAITQPGSFAKGTFDLSASTIKFK